MSSPAHIADELLQIRPVQSFPGVKGAAVKLAQLFLMERADGQIANHLSCLALPFATFGSKAVAMTFHNSRVATLVRQDLSHRARSTGDTPKRQR